MKRILFVLNEAPHGSERSYNALPHAVAPAKHEEVDTRLFLIADATAALSPGRRPPKATTRSNACSRA